MFGFFQKEDLNTIFLNDVMAATKVLTNECLKDKKLSQIVNDEDRIAQNVFLYICNFYKEVLKKKINPLKAYSAASYTISYMLKGSPSKEKMMFQFFAQMETYINEELPTLKECYPNREDAIFAMGLLSVLIPQCEKEINNGIFDETVAIILLYYNNVIIKTKTYNYK